MLAVRRPSGGTGRVSDAARLVLRAFVRRQLPARCPRRCRALPGGATAGARRYALLPHRRKVEKPQTTAARCSLVADLHFFHWERRHTRYRRQGGRWMRDRLRDGSSGSQCDNRPSVLHQAPLSGRGGMGSAAWRCRCLGRSAAPLRAALSRRRSRGDPAPPRVSPLSARAPATPRAWYFSTRRRAGAAEPRARAGHVTGRAAPAAALTSPPTSAGAASPAGKDKRAADEPRPPAPPPPWAAPRWASSTSPPTRTAAATAPTATTIATPTPPSRPWRGEGAQPARERAAPNPGDRRHQEAVIHPSLRLKCSFGSRDGVCWRAWCQHKWLRLWTCAVLCVLGRSAGGGGLLFGSFRWFSRFPLKWIGNAKREVNMQWWLMMQCFYSHYADIDPENQNFLLDSSLGKKKYETQYVSI